MELWATVQLWLCLRRRESEHRVCQGGAQAGAARYPGGELSSEHRAAGLGPGGWGAALVRVDMIPARLRVTAWGLKSLFFAD